MSQNTKTNTSTMNVFDRLAKKLQRDRTALNEDYHKYNYIKDEVFKMIHFSCLAMPELWRF